MIKTINPANNQVIQTYKSLTQEEAFQCIEKAKIAYQSWRNTSFDERAKLLRELAVRLHEKKEVFATLMANEMGKPLQNGISEIEKCAWVCEHYAAHAKTYLKDEVVKTDMKDTRVVYRPIGVIFAIMPWNFPFWQVFRYAVPTIAAGNTTILKHAPISSGSGEAIAALFLEAGFPEHVFQHIVLDNEVAGDVISHESIAGVTFTGSEKAGRHIASLAGAHLKRVVLELGGSDPAIVFHDADVKLAAKVIVASRLSNTGQVCISAKRVIVHHLLKTALLQAIQEEVKAYVIGPPLDKKTMLGPMARADLRDMVHKQVEASVAKGATLELGGVVPESEGFYYPPTILTNVVPGMPAFDEEVFGPVIALIEAKDEAHAIELANQTQYGLGASIFTRDEARGEQIAADTIEAGSCFVNGKVSSDPRVPFGGIKHSGFGRELAREGILAFVNIKTVAIGHA